MVELPLRLFWSSPLGTRSAGTPSARKNLSITCPGLSGGPESYPRRFTYRLPFGKRSRARCARCTTSAVLPTPAMPRDSRGHQRRNAAPGQLAEHVVKGGQIGPAQR